MRMEAWGLGKGEQSGVHLPLSPPPWNLLKKEQQGMAKLIPFLGPIQMSLI